MPSSETERVHNASPEYDDELYRGSGPAGRKEGRRIGSEALPAARPAEVPRPSRVLGVPSRGSDLDSHAAHRIYCSSESSWSGLRSRERRTQLATGAPGHELGQDGNRDLAVVCGAEVQAGRGLHSGEVGRGHAPVAQVPEGRGGPFTGRDQPDVSGRGT
jgi:hypothetical protein